MYNHYFSLCLSGDLSANYYHNFTKCDKLKQFHEQLSTTIYKKLYYSKKFIGGICFH